MIHRKKNKDLILGIDAANIRSGGGLTHLTQLIEEYAINPVYFSKIIIFSSKNTLNKVLNNSKVTKLIVNKKRYIDFFLWQMFVLPKALKKYNCDILLSPGGINIINFKPKVVMCRNMLPFDNYQLANFGISLNLLKFLTLRIFQSYSFKYSSGVVFLNESAKNMISKKINLKKINSTIIPHGLSDRFFKNPKPQFPINYYTEKNKFKILYVSNFDIYKNHYHLIKSIELLKDKNKNLNIELNLVGQLRTPYNKKILKKLSRLINKINNKYDGLINVYENVIYEDIHLEYFKADLFVYASSCENMPNILLESMASGLPIACSDYIILKEITKNAAIYFDPENEVSIFTAIKKLIDSSELRKNISEKSYVKAKEFSWKLTTGKLLEYIYITHNKYSTINR